MLMDKSVKYNSPILQLAFFSLWRPEPLPPKDNKLLSVKMQPIGQYQELTRRIIALPNMKIMLKNTQVIGRVPMMRVLWDVKEGVILQYRAEQGSLDVVSITAISAVNDKLFYKLYVQMYEQFSTIVLDDMTHQFFTPNEFHKKVK